MYRLSENIDKSKVFIVNRSEIEGRFDVNYNSQFIRQLVNKIKSKKFVRLIQITEPIKNGSTPPAGKFQEKGVKYYRSQDFSLYEFENNQYISKEFNEKIIRSYVKKKDILLAVVGATLGKVGYVHSEEIEGNINQNIARIRINDTQFIPEFIAIYLNSDIGQKLIQRYATITAQAYLNNQQLGSIPIPLIGLEQQKSIINTIRGSYTQKQKKEAEAQRLLDSIDGYLLGELGIVLPNEEDWQVTEYDMPYGFTFSSENPLVKNGRLFLASSREVSGGRIDPDYNKAYYLELLDSIRTIKYKYLKELTNFIDYGLMPTQDYATDISAGIPFIRVTNILETGYIDMTDIKYIPFDTPNIEKKRVKEKDILMVQCGSTTGKVAIVPKKFENFLANSFSFVIRSNSEIIQEFLFYVLANPLVQKQIKRTQNIVSVRPNTSKPAIENLLIPLPPLEKQQEIADKISQIRAKALQLQQEATQILEQTKLQIEKMILGD